jgi:hypothetical protein
MFYRSPIDSHYPYPIRWRIVVAVYRLWYCRHTVNVFEQYWIQGAFHFVMHLFLPPSRPSRVPILLMSQWTLHYYIRAAAVNLVVLAFVVCTWDVLTKSCQPSFELDAIVCDEYWCDALPIANSRQSAAIMQWWSTEATVSLPSWL